MDSCTRRVCSQEFRAEQERAGAAAAARPGHAQSAEWAGAVEQEQYQCEYDCGYVGTHEEVERHELTCQQLVTMRSRSVVLSQNPADHLPVAGGGGGGGRRRRRRRRVAPRRVVSPAHTRALSYRACSSICPARLLAPPAPPSLPSGGLGGKLTALWRIRPTRRSRRSRGRCWRCWRWPATWSTGRSRPPWKRASWRRRCG